MALVTNVIEGDAAERVLLLLHGYGADERDLGGLLPYLDPEGHFATVLPRGPLAAPPGFSWFDLASPDPDTALAGFTEALDLIDDLLDTTVCRARHEARGGGRRGVLARWWCSRSRSACAEAIGRTRPVCSR